MNIDLTFADGYQLEPLDELPGTATTRLFYIPPRGTGGEDGILLRVLPNAVESWIGCFAFGHLGTGLSAVISLPRQRTFAVISEGAGYILDATSPQQWSEVGCLPVIDAHVLREHRLVLFSDFTRIVAYGTTGIAWYSQRLCWDDLKIVDIQGTTIRGTGYDPTNSERPEGQFELDVLTGQVRRSDFAYAHEEGLF